MKIVFIFAILASSAFAQIDYTTRGFHKFGSIKGAKFTKNIWLSVHYNASWYEAKSFCNSLGMQYLTLDTIEEHNYFLTTMDKAGTPMNSAYFIGAFAKTPKNPTDWYWVETGKKVAYPLKWQTNEPASADGSEMCMNVVKGSFPNHAFNDVTCTSWVTKFYCQSMSL